MPGLRLVKGETFHRVVLNEGGLHQLVLHKGFKGGVEQLAAGDGGVGELQAQALCKLAGRSVVRAGKEIRAGEVLHGVVHAPALKRRGQVDDFALVLDLCGAAHQLGALGEDLFCQVHHAVVVGVGLVHLHGGEFRVVLDVHALVAEQAGRSRTPAQNRPQ